jgi:DNA polymerase I
MYSSGLASDRRGDRPDGVRRAEHAKSHEERGYRACVVPAPGNAFVIADLSQVEVCVAAELANDTALIATLKAGADVHAMTASTLFGEPITKPDPRRDAAKAMTFGRIYGESEIGLARRLADYGLDPSQAPLFAERFAQQ